VLEKKTVELLWYSRSLDAIRIVNRHTRGTIEKALKGGKVGTIIRAK
jgi:isopentenyl phosphate kinase